MALKKQRVKNRKQDAQSSESSHMDHSSYNAAHPENRKGESDMDVQHNLGILLSVVAVAGSVLMLAFFFILDVPDNIKASVSPPPASSQPVDHSDDDQQEDSDASSQRDQADDSDVGAEGHDDNDDETSAVEMNKEDVKSYLRDMDDSEFKSFAEDVARKNASDQQDASQILEEAYAEAEKQYPNKIDGSRRLKLIDDLNATDYKYYVVEKGDHLGDLSDKFDVPMGQMVELNGIHNADLIHRGSILLMPEHTESPDH